jgi:L-lactate dehydrogenase
VSSVLTEYKGISDVALSVPCVVGAGGVERVVDVPMTDLELRKLQASAAALKATISKLGLD